MRSSRICGVDAHSEEKNTHGRYDTDGSAAIDNSELKARDHDLRLLCSVMCQPRRLRSETAFVEKPEPASLHSKNHSTHPKLIPLNRTYKRMLPYPFIVISFIGDCPRVMLTFLRLSHSRGRSPCARRCFLSLCAGADASPGLLLHYQGGPGDATERESPENSDAFLFWCPGPPRSWWP